MPISEARKRANLRWQEKNIERVKAYQAEWRKNNKEKMYLNRARQYEREKRLKEEFCRLSAICF